MKTKNIAMALSAPFDIADIDFVGKGKGAKIIAAPYLTNRAIQQRLDEVVGIENWKNEFTESPSGGVLCGLSIRIDGEWITKWDGAEVTQIEPVKGGLSGAMKRAAVQWGIGRFLYSAPRLWVDAETYRRGNNTYTKLGDTGKKQAAAMLKQWLDTITRPYPVPVIIKRLKAIEKNHRYDDMPEFADDVFFKVGEDLMLAIFGSITAGAYIAMHVWLNGNPKYSALELDALRDEFSLKRSTAADNVKDGNNVKEVEHES